MMDCKCRTCGKLFSKSRNLNRHLKEVHQTIQDRRKCVFCGVTFTRQSTLNRHTKARHASNDAPSTSVIPDASYLISSTSSASLITVVPQTSHREQLTSSLSPQSSSKAGSSKRRTKDIKKNISNKFKTMDFKCSTCGKLFSQSRNLNRHLREVHQAIQDRRKCVFCGVTFTRQSTLNHHTKARHASDDALSTSVIPDASHLISSMPSASLTTVVPVPSRREQLTSNWSRPSSCKAGSLKRRTEDIKTNMSMKLKTMEEPKKQRCLMCHSTFTCKYRLFRHIQKMHRKKEPKKHRCLYCLATYTTKFGLYQHTKQKHPVAAPVTTTTALTSAMVSGPSTTTSTVSIQLPASPCEEMKYSSIWPLFKPDMKQERTVQDQYTLIAAVDNTDSIFNSDQQQIQPNLNGKVKGMTSVSSCLMDKTESRNKIDFLNRGYQLNGSLVDSIPDFQGTQNLTLATGNIEQCNRRSDTQFKSGVSAVRRHTHENSDIPCTNFTHSASINIASIQREVEAPLLFSDLVVRDTLNRSLKEYKYKCGVCFSRFIKKGNFNRHKIFHLEKNPYKCNKCAASFPQKHFLKIHLKSHYEYKCNLCAAKFTHYIYLQEHNKRNHSAEKQNDCDTGAGSSADSPALNTHNTNNGEKALYTCEICPASFSHPHSLNRHLPVHATNKPYRCDVCDVACVSKTSLASHKFRYHRERRHRHQCEMCAQKFPHKSDIINHILKHTGERPFKCDMCPSSFRIKPGLDRHKIKHTRTVNKPYKCDICSASFSSSQSLKKHKQRHTGEKPFMCQICGATFAARLNLTTHLRTHTGEKPFRCQLCNASFTQESSLYRHQVLHTGQRQYKCEICAYRFNQRSSLLRHQKIHSGKKLFKCDVCTARFTCSSEFQTHTKIHTEEII